ncbi:NADP-dependent oxidoreductase domain-containing protein [Peziza echinospora]|nr:NADP-dependent oxidoreductase domain-containing protein [Peziza echinospora]
MSLPPPPPGQTTKPHHPPLSTVIPPLSLGSATFNAQYNPDPSSLPTTHIIQHALAHGIRAFDTSPYYGPAETLLGAALQHLSPPRNNIFLSTKVGRKSATCFNYTPEWVRHSIERSITRLLGPEEESTKTTPPTTTTRYLDLVFCHDIEFVTPAEVLAAVLTLRGLRTLGKIKYIGLSGYPLPVLCELAEYVLAATGEPVDAIMSYANYTLQNTRLWRDGVERLRTKGGVDVVMNASPLGMGLLRETGVPVGSMGDWHPAERALRERCKAAGERCRELAGEKLEVVALRWALETWRERGAGVGTSVLFEGEKRGEGQEVVRKGVSCCGVSYVSELEETLEIWKSVLRAEEGVEADVQRKKKVEELAEVVRGTLGEWADYAWDSPDQDFVRTRDTEKFAAV